MHKGKKISIIIAITALALALLSTLLATPAPPITNGSPIEPEATPRRINLGEQIHEDHNGYHHYYYHGYHSYRFIIGHLAISGTRAGMSNIEVYTERGWNITIGQKQYHVVDYDYQWIELKELG